MRRYGDRFVVYVIPDQKEEEAQSDGRQRIALQVLPRAVGMPAPTQGWQVFGSIVLFFLTLTSTVRGLALQ
jgi:hypothetical protein